MVKRKSSSLHFVLHSDKSHLSSPQLHACFHQSFASKRMALHQTGPPCSWRTACRSLACSTIFLHHASKSIVWCRCWFTFLNNATQDFGLTFLTAWIHIATIVSWLNTASFWEDQTRLSALLMSFLSYFLDQLIISLIYRRSIPFLLNNFYQCIGKQL